MASLVLSGDTSGSITVSAPAVAGSNTQTLVATTGTLAPIVSGTAVSASGTSVDFTSIPSWVKRITVMFSGVSTNGTSAITVRLGDSGGVETTGYAGITIGIGAGGSVAPSALSSGFQICDAAVAAAAATWSGQLIINQLNSSTNTWSASGGFGRGDSAITGFSQGAKSLSDTLTQVRITTVNGTDTFDAGTINILYE